MFSMCMCVRIYLAVKYRRRDCTRERKRGTITRVESEHYPSNELHEPRLARIIFLSIYSSGHLNLWFIHDVVTLPTFKNVLLNLHCCLICIYLSLFYSVFFSSASYDFVLESSHAQPRTRESVKFIFLQISNHQNLARPFFFVFDPSILLQVQLLQLRGTFFWNFNVYMKLALLDSQYLTIIRWLGSFQNCSRRTELRNSIAPSDFLFSSDSRCRVFFLAASQVLITVFVAAVGKSKHLVQDEKPWRRSAIISSARWLPRCLYIYISIDHWSKRNEGYLL